MKKIALYRNDWVIISVAPRIARFVYWWNASRRNVRYPYRVSGMISIALPSSMGASSCPDLRTCSSILAITLSASSWRPWVTSQRGLSGSTRPTMMTTRASTGPSRNASRQPTLGAKWLRKM